jgi:hypothetical protein
MSLKFELQGITSRIVVLTGEHLNIVATGVWGDQIRFEAGSEKVGYGSDTFQIKGQAAIAWSLRFGPGCEGATLVRATLLDANGNGLAQTETTVWVANPEAFARLVQPSPGPAAGGGYGLASTGPGTVGMHGLSMGGPGAGGGYQPAPAPTASTWQASDALSDVLKAKQAELLARLAKR